MKSSTHWAWAARHQSSRSFALASLSACNAQEGMRGKKSMGEALQSTGNFKAVHNSPDCDKDAINES